MDSLLLIQLHPIQILFSNCYLLNIANSVLLSSHLYSNSYGFYVCPSRNSSIHFLSPLLPLSGSTPTLYTKDTHQSHTSDYMALETKWVHISQFRPLILSQSKRDMNGCPSFLSSFLESLESNRCSKSLLNIV